jgi:hypothetical protein
MRFFVRLGENAVRKSFYGWALTTVICLSAAAASAGADSGWKMPNLNPFASKTSTASRPPTSGWKMPNLLPKTAAPKRRTNQPSTLGKMTKGTQQFFSKTADALNPWDSKQPEPAAKITGSNSIFTNQSKTTKAENKSSSVSPASWWGGDNKDSRPKSVNDFLSQQRP